MWLLLLRQPLRSPMLHHNILSNLVAFFLRFDFETESNLPRSLLRLEILLMFLFQIRCNAEIVLLPIFPIFLMICNFARLLLEDNLLVLWFCELGNSALIFLLLLKLHKLFSQSPSNIFLSQTELLKQSRMGFVFLCVHFSILQLRLHSLHFLLLRYIGAVQPLGLV